MTSRHLKLAEAVTYTVDDVVDVVPIAGRRADHDAEEGEVAVGADKAWQKGERKKLVSKVKTMGHRQCVQGVAEG